MSRFDVWLCCNEITFFFLWGFLRARTLFATFYILSNLITQGRSNAFYQLKILQSNFLFTSESLVWFVYFCFIWEGPQFPSEQGEVADSREWSRDHSRGSVLLGKTLETADPRRWSRDQNTQISKAKIMPNPSEKKNQTSESLYFEIHLL